ncbi:DUF4350 domain-containing protein [Halogeometricum sp. S1BR25-6]|uniref:DUF4350 domain-containing protein n=1 Tax=Halogeometricum salsisoli TaxID=2950536 RepID=A0ABU2GHJ4_9EURY|nr:DUF4350 domain-containing protein [Halogeometricum sp. S1BR25-6]MDS0300302.1 DUF4350 domain-containing protein [Halogeometricum sp. S1BR25-6]
MVRIPDVDLPRLLLVGLALSMLVSVGAVASTSSSAFSVSNSAWEGTSSLQQQASAVDADSTIVTNTTEYARVDPTSSVAVILSPTRPYTPAETERVREFVRSGGTLVVAEDFGPHTNPLLDAVGARTRIDGRPLRDERQYYRSPDIVVATEVSEHPLTGEVSQLTLNHGTALRPNGSRVLVNSSPFAYLDTNRNGSLDSAESIDTYPVVTLEAVGDGRVVVVSDPSVFINAMLDRPGNEQFARLIFSGHETVLLDYSHRSGLPPLTAAAAAVRQSNALRAVVGFASIGLVAFVYNRSRDE